MKLRQQILIAILILFSISYINSASETNQNSINNKIIEHYRKYALYTEESVFNVRKLYIYPIAFAYIGKLYTLADMNRMEGSRALYGYHDNVLYPIHNYLTHNEYVNVLSIQLRRFQIIEYFKQFLRLQWYYSRNLVFTNIENEKLLKRYGRHGKKGFKKRLEEYYAGEPFLSYNEYQDEYHVSIPTFTALGENLYFRLRITHGIVTSKGIIRRIWGEKPQYFIYNGETARLLFWQIKHFENTVY